MKDEINQEPSNVIFNGRYQVKENIGKGSSSSVFLAWDLQLKRYVALKIETSKNDISNNSKRFKIEANLLMMLKNDNIVAIYDYFVVSGKQIIVMEYLQGKTLEEYIRNKTMLTNAETTLYLLQICNALKELHEKRIIHRDLKPQNIFVTKKNQIKLIDLGIAKINDDQELTKLLSVVGTPEYISPEVITGFKSTTSSDIYALGIVAYKMLTGFVPFKGDDSSQTASLHLNNLPILINKINVKVNPKLEQMIYKMIEKSPAKRYQNVIEIEIDLRAILKTNHYKMTSESESFKFLEKKNQKHSKSSKLIGWALISIVTIITLFIIFYLFHFH